MQGLQFERYNEDEEMPQVVGHAPVKRATRFVDHQEKLMQASGVKKGILKRRNGEIIQGH